MTKRDKLLHKVRNNPRAVSIRDLQFLLESFGFALDRIAGSHYIYVGTVAGEGVTVVIPLKRPNIKAGYVKDVLALIDQIAQVEASPDDQVS